jgi:hypothetical protein
MGTRPSNTDTQKRLSSKPPRCSLCKQEYTPMCEFMQGRCPHHPAMVSIKEVKTRFKNIIKFFKRTSK